MRKITDAQPQAILELNPDIPAWRLDHLGHYPQTEGAGDVLAAYLEFREGD